MEPASALTTLLRHNLWANTQLAKFCADLKPDVLDGKVAGTYGAIHDTFVHMAGAEQRYLHRIATKQRYVPPALSAPPSMLELCSSLKASGEQLINAALEVTPTDTIEVDWDNRTEPVHLPLTILITQVINHATEHRAQIMTTLTQLGIEPPNLDAWTYFEATMM